MENQTFSKPTASRILYHCQPTSLTCHLCGHIERCEALELNTRVFVLVSNALQEVFKVFLKGGENLIIKVSLLSVLPMNLFMKKEI